MAADRPSGPPYDPTQAAHRRDPYPTYARMRHEAPVFWSEQAGAWIVSRYEDIVDVLTDAERFTAVGSIGIEPPTAFAPEVQAVFDAGMERFPGIIEMDPPEHTRYRNLVNLAFTPRRVASLEPRIQEVTDDLVDRVAAAGEVDFVRGFAFPLPMTIIAEIVGVPAADNEHVQALADGFRTLEAGTMSQLSLDDQLDTARRFVDFQAYARGMIEDRRRQPRDDLLSTIMGAKLAGERPLTDAELVSTIIHLLFAGQETNARVLGSAMAILLEDRSRWLALVADPSLASSVFEEALRMEPPVTYHLRTPKVPVAIAGVTIPAGEPVQLLFASGNHDETTFDRPDAYEPRRPGITRHLGFGRGVHFCVGAPIARLESRVALSTLARRLPGLELVPGQRIEREPHIMLRGIEALFVRWDPAMARPR